MLVQALRDVDATPSVEGWARTPWRSWKNAAALCVRLWEKHRTLHAVVDEARDACATIVEALNNEHVDYWDVVERASLVNQTYTDGPSSEALMCAMTIVRLGVSNSDGGGHAFAERLGRLFLAFSTTNIDIAAEVYRARLRDALGPNADPRRVQAFQVAWDMGRYELCYLV